MTRIVMLAAVLLVIGSASARAQEKECFTVIMPPDHGPTGAILLNRCTGQTWVLGFVDATKMFSHWYPIPEEKNPLERR
jgi:hypothetical protein